jgi:hypothetical protein
MMTPTALSWIFSAASSRLIAMTLPVRGENLAVRLNIKG